LQFSFPNEIQRDQNGGGPDLLNKGDDRVKIQPKGIKMKQDGTKVLRRGNGKGDMFMIRKGEGKDA